MSAPQWIVRRRGGGWYYVSEAWGWDPRQREAHRFGSEQKAGDVAARIGRSAVVRRLKPRQRRPTVARLVQLAEQLEVNARGALRRAKNPKWTIIERHFALGQRNGLEAAAKVVRWLLEAT